VQFDDSWQVALDIEQVMDGKRLVFLPGAPDFWSGSVCAVAEERVKPLDASVQALVSTMKRLGADGGKIIRPKDNSQSEYSDSR
jgi:uncharacterized membrane protein